MHFHLFLLQPSLVLVLLTVSNRISAPPPFSEPHLGQLEDLGHTSTNHQAYPSPNNDEAKCDPDTVQRVLASMDPELTSASTQNVHMADNPRAATLNFYQHSPYQGDQPDAGSEGNRLTAMAYHNHAVDLDWPAPWRNPHGPEYGATHLTTPQNIVQHNPGMQNDYQLFAVTERQSEAGHDGGPFSKAPSLQSLQPDNSSRFLAPGSQAPVDVPLTWKGRRDSYSTTIPSQTDDIAATDREQPRSFGGSSSGFRNSARPFAVNQGSSTDFRERWLRHGQTDFVPGTPENGLGFIRGQQDARRDNNELSCDHPESNNYMNVRFEYPRYTNTELNNNRNRKTSGFHPFAHRPAKSGFSQGNRRALSGTKGQLEFSNPNRNQNGEGKRYNDRSIGYSGLPTRYSETPIQQTGRFPFNDPPAKDTGANFLKTDWYHQFSRPIPEVNIGYLTEPGHVIRDTSGSNLRSSGSPTPPKELGSLYAAVRATSIPNIEESDVISGQKRVDYSKTSDHPLLSDKTRDHVTSAVPAQVGRPITQAEVANSLASTTKSAKIGIRKLTRETGEQNLISRLEVKTKEGSRTHTVGIPPIEGQDIEIKRIIQEYQLDESGKKSENAADDKTRKTIETKRGKTEHLAAGEDPPAEDRRSRLEKKEKKEKWMANLSPFEKKKRRNPAIGSGSKGPASHVIEPNQKAQIEENIKILDSPSQDRSEGDKAKLQGDSTTLVTNGPVMKLPSIDKLGPDMQVTSGQPNKSAQGQNVADNSKTSNDHTVNPTVSEADHRVYNAIQDRRATNQEQSSKPSPPLNSISSRSRNPARKKETHGEEEKILRLIKIRRQSPEPNLVFSSPRPLYFKVNYASDDRALEESFEEYKAGLYSDADQPEDTKSKAEDTKKKQEDSGYKPGSITAPLKIDERVLPKKIATVFDSLDKKIRYEAVVGMKPCRLHDFSDSTVKVFFQLWGEETVLGWDQENLDIALMARLALELNLHHKTPHSGISPSSQRVELYERFRANFINAKFKFHKVEAAVAEILGKAESSRRFAAFFCYLQEETTARNWKLAKKTFIQRRLMKESDASSFEQRLGLSTDPALILNIPTQPGFRKMKGPFARSMDFVGEMMLVTFGQEVAKKKLELSVYLMDRRYRPRWWESLGLEEASKKFGLNLVQILKVGDVLQFGSNSFIKESEVTVPIDVAFRTIINIIKQEKPHLPWMESPERAWLHKNIGGLYQDRLRILSQLFMEECTKRNDPRIYRAYELVWCDLGLETNELRIWTERPVSKEVDTTFASFHWLVRGLSNFERRAFSIWLRCFYMEHHQYDPLNPRAKASWGGVIGQRWARLKNSRLGSWLAS
ncbi:hypothetical protein PSHT_03451 [Puccinia striiformis]|uniref:Uncharacterized protein n=1 Tax=Puccinia striiformis TaxID=27350 RepID=A0A2S4WFE3_9BASI|nr:hypothetical protein PSHT_03451 [Puccinia striiformis]